MAEPTKDKNMGWVEIAGLLITYGPQGIDLAEKLWTKWSTKAPVTAQDFTDLRALVNQTATDRLKLQLTKAGIKLDSPEALALLAQAGA